jgi:hypothetical protein
MYGLPSYGQGQFGGNSTGAVSGDGCTLLIDQCSLLGCGSNALCTNSGPNERTCQCVIGYAFNSSTPYVTSNTFTNSQTTSGCTSMLTCSFAFCLLSVCFLFSVFCFLFSFFIYFYFSSLLTSLLTVCFASIVLY